MSRWGVFHDVQGDIHVAPCYPDGRIALSHEVRKGCACVPRLEKSWRLDADGDPIEIYVHQDREKGGCDA